MGWQHWATITSFIVSANLAHAADKPQVDAPAAWIKPIKSPVFSAPQDAAALHVLLRDVQVSFHGDTTRSFTSVAIHVAKPEALTALGTFSLAWKPDTDRVVVHWLRIRRGNTVIDVLAQQQFTILRREQNLEFAALDGILTATMPISGLQVGDVVEYAWTIERTEPILKGHHDLALDAGTSGNIAQLGVAAQWDSDDRVVVHTENLAGPAKTTPTSITLASGPIEPLILPQGAPMRFRYGRMIELSDFSDWASVSAIFTPLFATARQLKADSPLHAEIARIKAATVDPAARAGLALKLVEDNVRYLFIGLNDSNLRPAPADETWQRRFGDCKAKTALLLAVLDELGIKAEAALVSTRLGDGLDQRLPNISQFDHVIVRATIAGKIYWLDGTRSGDRNIAELAVPDFHWALPLKAEGGALEALVVAAKTVPTSVYDLHLDASKGVWAPASAHADVTFTGDAGFAMHSVLAGVTKGALDQQLRDYWSRQYDFITPQNVNEVWDEATRTERLAMDGTARMAWNDAGDGGRRYELDGAAVGWHGDFRRQAGPNSDAPFAQSFPDFAEYRETVILPDNGRGFSLAGKNVDRELAGFAIYRQTKIAGNRVTMVARQRALARELPYAQAQAANDDLRALADGAVNIDLDNHYQLTDDDTTALLAVPNDKTVNGYRTHLQAYVARYDASNGLAEAQRYVAAFPQSAEALTLRAYFEAGSGMDQAAKADMAAATRIDPDRHSQTWLTTYYTYIDDPASAGTTHLLFFPWLRWSAAETCRRQRDYACARKNAQAALALQTNDADIYLSLANTYKGEGNSEEAAAVADRMIAAAPRDASILAIAGVVYCSTGQRAKGLAAFAASLAIKPSIEAYLNRIRFLPASAVAARKSDIDGAFKLDPKNTDALLALANWQSETGDQTGATATLAAMTAQNSASAEPDIAQTISIGAAYARAGQADKARENFAEARGYAAALKNGHNFNSLCYAAAVANFDLSTALADCTRAVTLLPNAPAVLDSLGFVQLRLGHYVDAVAAYDKALAIDPQEAHSLFGKGIAHLRQGDQAKGHADIAAAAKIDPDVADAFNAMGVTP